MIRKSENHKHTSSYETLDDSETIDRQNLGRGQRSKRLVIGPANHAGQAREWCLAVTRELGIEAASIDSARVPLFRSRHHKNATHILPYHRLTPNAARRLLVHRFLRDATSIAIDGYIPLYGDPKSGNLLEDVRKIERRGQGVVLIAHGSEVRDPTLHMDRLAYSHFRTGDSAWRNTLGNRAARNRTVAAEARVPLLVSTPDLLLDLPNATWLPITVRTDRWTSSAQVLERRKLRVLHVPSARRPSIKGTDHIHPTLKRLAAEGLIDYFTSDFMPRNELRAIVREADIVVDQLLVGSFGVAAVEAMAAGRLVVGNIAPDVRDLIGFNVPIVDATPDSFADVIRQILNNASDYRETAAAGVVYTQSHHSGNRSARILAQALEWHLSP